MQIRLTNGTTTVLNMTSSVAVFFKAFFRALDTFQLSSVEVSCVNSLYLLLNLFIALYIESVLNNSLAASKTTFEKN